MAAVLALRKLERPEVATMLHDARPAIVLEAARAINDVPIESAMPQLATLVSDVNLLEPILLRALNANFRIGGEENAKAVSAFAARSDVSDVLRIEALAMLKEWDKPRGVDRVVGLWRPLPNRDLAMVQRAARPVLPGIVTSAPDAVRVAAIEVLKKVGVDDPLVLFKLATDEKLDPSASAAALGAMDELHDPKLAEAVDWALANGKGALRLRAIRLLPSRPDAEKRINAILASDSTSDQQAAITTLGSVNVTWAQQILAAQLDKLIAGKLPGEDELELLEATEKSANDAVKAKRKKFDDARPKDNQMANFRESLLGGDAAAGHKIFAERQDVSCVRCHKVNGTGGVAGPDLSSVATRHDRNYFLESIINPNAQIAPGFESVTVNVKAGHHYTGVVMAENDTEIVINAGDGATIHIEKKEVESFLQQGVEPDAAGYFQDAFEARSSRSGCVFVDFEEACPATTHSDSRIGRAAANRKKPLGLQSQGFVVSFSVSIRLSRRTERAIPRASKRLVPRTDLSRIPSAVCGLSFSLRATCFSLSPSSRLQR